MNLLFFLLLVYQLASEDIWYWQKIYITKYLTLHVSCFYSTSKQRLGLKISSHTIIWLSTKKYRVEKKKIYILIYICLLLKKKVRQFWILNIGHYSHIINIKEQKYLYSWPFKKRMNTYNVQYNYSSLYAKLACCHLHNYLWQK